MACAAPEPAAVRRLLPDKPREPMAEVTGLFPTPLMRVPRLLPATLVARLLEQAGGSDKVANSGSGRLSHSRIVDPAEGGLFGEVAGRVMPRMVDFGSLLFGENLRWTIKEMWLNVLETGGHQGVHAHANSFISAVLFLTPSHPSARTVFHKALGGSEYVFSNFNPAATIGPFNGNKWALPAVEPGDLVLYPSYLLHEVPENRGGRRVSLAMNAIPHRLRSQGYELSFGT